MNLSPSITPSSDRVFFVVSKKSENKSILTVKVIDLSKVTRTPEETQKLAGYINTKRLGYIDEFNKVHLDSERVKSLDNVIRVKDKKEQYLTNATIVQAIDENEYEQYKKLIKTHIADVSWIRVSENKIIKPFFAASYQQLSIQFAHDMHKIVNRVLDRFAENIRENDQRKEDEYQRSLVNEMYKLGEIKNAFLKKWNLKQDLIKASL